MTFYDNFFTLQLVAFCVDLVKRKGMSRFIDALFLFKKELWKSNY